MDGSSRQLSAGLGVVLLLTTPNGDQVEKVVRLGFPTSSNEVEYEVITSSLDLATILKAQNLKIPSDSQLVVA